MRPTILIAGLGDLGAVVLELLAREPWAGRIQRRTSSPMRTGIASSALLVCGSQDPRARPTRILGRAPKPRTMAGERSEGMLFDIGYADGLTPVLAVPETPVPDGARAG